jgi:oxygen-independent coproporphyrinogen-3 oxidase
VKRWQNVRDYRAYIDRVLSGESPRESSEDLTHEMKRTERIALALRTREGIAASELKSFRSETSELIALELLRESHGNFVLTRRGKTLADSVAEAFV